MNTIIEKIRAEVERLKQEIYPVKVGEQRVNRGPTSMESAALGALNTLMSRIFTLQEKSEKPINQDDIDTEIGHWMDHLDDKYCMLVNHYSIQDIKDTARHFYELGRQSQCVKVKAESSIDKFILENCTHCTIEHCPGMRECYTSSNKQLQ